MDTYLVLITLALCRTVHGVAFGTYDCPAPWLGNGAMCYKFNLFAANIGTAKADCSVDGATLLSVPNQNVNDFIVAWLKANAKLGLSWFTSGIVNPAPTGPLTEISYKWEADGTDIQSNFWFSLADRSLPGNRIVYRTDGSSWGWSLVVDTQPATILPYICQIAKANIYEIVTQSRGFDFGVPEIDPSQLPQGPHMINEPQDVTYDTASVINYVVMNCEAQALPFATYLWFVTHNMVLAPVDLSDSSKTVTNGRLTITKPQDTKDNGIYQCIATNQFGSILSRQASLSFGYLNDFPKAPRQPVVAIAYTGTPIQCIPPKTGYSTISYAWYKGSTLNLIRSNVKWYIFVSSDGTLYFQAVTKDDAGDYFCLVTRPNSAQNFQEGKTSVAIPLIVKEAVGSNQDPAIVNSFPKAFPTAPQVGDNLRLECVAYGTEILQYSWRYLDGAMPTAANFSDYNRVLTIANVQLQHGGNYRCTVSRQLGQSTSKDITVVIEAAPFFTIPLIDQHMDIASTVKFQCYANGVPAISYNWYINAVDANTSISKMLPSDQARYSITNNVLTITSVTMKDAAMFQCAASNTHGLAYSSGQLRVLEFAPTFTKFPLLPNQYTTVTGNATLICNPEAAPVATKTWYKDGQPLNPSTDPSARVQMLANGNIHITNADTPDAGNYTCEATNYMGTASTAGVLTILPTTTIVQAPRDTVVHVNSTAFFACEAMYNPVTDLIHEWWHNNYKLMFIKVRNLGNHVWVFNEPNYERGTGVFGGGLYITNAQFYHAGRYSCVITSTTQTFTATATLVVIGPPGPPGGVLGFGAKNTSIQLSFWGSKANGSPVTSYVIESYNLFENFWNRSATVAAPVDPTAQIFAEVDNLSPYTQYMFRVIGVNALGEGDPSTESATYRTTQAPPITYPKGLIGGGGKVGTLNISWTPMSVADWNADAAAVGYIVYWRKAEDTNNDQFDSYKCEGGNSSKLVVTLGAENFYLAYYIKIKAYNSMGIGPESPVVEIMSAEDIPKGVPIHMKAVYFNATAITVEWLPVENTREVMKGVLEGYRINYWIDGEEIEVQALFRVIRNQTDNGLIIGLRENTYYIINVQAINTAGNGPKSENYRTRTLRAAPMEAPQDVRVRIHTYNSVLLKWRGVYTTIMEEPLVGYTVRYFERGENIYVATDVDAGKAITFVLGPLKQNVQYELRVYGTSRGGWGLQSSPTLEFIIASNCDALEDSPDKEYVNECLWIGENGVSGTRSSLFTFIAAAILAAILTHVSLRPA